jgi:hypothetical protein
MAEVAVRSPNPVRQAHPPRPPLAEISQRYNHRMIEVDLAAQLAKEYAAHPRLDDAVMCTV